MHALDAFSYLQHNTERGRARKAIGRTHNNDRLEGAQSEDASGCCDITY